MLVLGHSAEFEGRIAVSALWPRTPIATAAISFIAGKEALRSCRKDSIMGDAAAAILARDLSSSGKFYIDDDVLREEGVTDFDQYKFDPSAQLCSDLFVEPSDEFPELKLQRPQK